MASYLEIYNGASLATAITVSLGPGDTSSTYSRSLWNDKTGAQSADASTGLRLVLEAYDGAKWVRSGMPILDELWCSIRITSVTNTGDPTFGPYATGTKRIGTNSELELPDLPADCAFNFDFVVFAPATIDTTAIQFRLVPVDQENSYGLANKLGMLGSGIVPGYRDTSLRRVVTGYDITASGTAAIAVSEGLVDFDGVRACGIETSHTLNQNDSAAAALGSGESYIATISVDSAGAVTATKGTKGTTPTAPAVPTDEILLGYVTVDYEVGGTSVIDQGDVDQGALIRGDYYLAAGAGLTVNIHSGAGVSTTSHYQFHGVSSSVSLAASDTSYIWRNPDGTFEDTLTEVAPQDGAELIAEADTDGAAVTAIRDRRVYLTPPIAEHLICLELGDITSTSTFADWALVPFDAEIYEVRLEAAANTAGSSGSYIIDINTAQAGEPSSGTWTTIYTSQGTADYRPTLAYDATSLTASTIFHEVRRVAKGSRISADVATVPAGSPTLGGARVYLVLRRYR